MTSYMVENYKKTGYKCVVIWVVAGLISVSMAYFLKLDIYIGVIGFAIVNDIVIGYASKRLFLARNQIQEKYKNDWDIDSACKTYEEIIASKYLVERNGVLCSYFLLLLNTCQFERFTDVYKENRNKIRNVFMWKYMRLLILYTSSLSKDRREFRKRLSRYHFSKYHKKKGKLNKIKGCQRFQDNTISILQLYENEEYQSAITMIDQIDIASPWDKLYVRSIKERCLFHLNEKYSIPEQEQTKFLFIKQWDMLVRTNEEYYDNRVNELLKMMHEDLKVSYVKFVVTFVVMLLVLLWVV